MKILFFYGADDGNRTHVVSLEGWSSTIELHLQKKMVTRERIELSTLWLKVKCSTTWATGSFNWLGWLGSNQRNDRVKVCCLTTWLHPNKWWRETDSNCRTRRELIYSQPRLATSLSLHMRKLTPYYFIKNYKYMQLLMKYALFC